MASFAFYALGSPAPQGSKRHVGKGHMVESSKEVRPWRATIVDAAPTIERTLDGPLAVKMVFTVKRPAGAKKTALRPFTLPDLSKYCRSTEDGITTAGLWKDDGRVAEYTRLAKVWTGYDADALPVPGVIVACVELDGFDGFGIRPHLDMLADAARCAAWDRVRGAA